MNHSIYSADRATHLKIVAVALLAAIAVGGLSLSFQSVSKTGPASRTAVLKAGKPVAVSSSATTLVR
jgi:hypothetical protein